METFRCPTCLFMLSDPGVKRCPSCHKKLRRGRGRPIVLGDKTHFGTQGTQGPADVDLLIAERAERARASFDKDPLVSSVPAPVYEAPIAATPPAGDAPPVVAPPAVVDLPPGVAVAPVVEPPPPVEVPKVETPKVETPKDETPKDEAPPAFAAPPYVPAPPVASEPATIQHTTIFEPSQFDPEMRQVLDSLYRKARSEPDDPA